MTGSLRSTHGPKNRQTYRLKDWLKDRPTSAPNRGGRA